MTKDEWYGCYQESLKGWICNSAFSHPAKASLALAKRIFAHAQAEGWIDQQSLIVDPMGGIGVFCLVAASEGIPSLAIELEPRFVELFRQNVELHRRQWEAMCRPMPRVIQGDARRLRELMKEAGLMVSSPPYAGKGEVLGGHNGIDYSQSQTGGRRATPARLASGENYGETDGQLAQMPPGDLSLILSSPPYADGCRQTGGVDQHPEHIEGGKQGHVLRSYPEASAIISSPPYANSVDAQSCGIDWTKMGPATGKRKRGPGTKHHETLMAQLSYQETSALNGQLGSMFEGSLAGIITSPPYAEGLSKAHTYQDHGKREKDSQRRIITERGIVDPFYGKSDGNLGNGKPESYWSEISKIYRACFDVLPTHGTMILVLKGYIRRGQYIDLPAQTAQLLEHVGFTVLHWHEALLTSQIGQLTLDGGETRKSRKSFFRRLSEAKGAPKINYEVVLCAVKPYESPEDSPHADQA